MYTLIIARVNQFLLLHYIERFERMYDTNTYAKLMETVSRGDVSETRKYLHHSKTNKYSTIVHNLEKMTAMHTAIVDVMSEDMIELLLDEGSDPGFGELMSGITPFQRIHIINNSRRTKNMYSTRLILKMLKSPSSLDFSKKQGRKNFHVRPPNTYSSHMCIHLITQSTHSR